MLLAPDDDQRQLIEAVADMLADEAPFDRWFLSQTDPLTEEARLLRFGAEMGWIGIAAPAAVGGAQGDLVDEALIFRQIGSRLGPLGLAGAAIGIQVALAAGDAPLAKRILSGEAPVGMAVAGQLIGGGAAEFALALDGARLSLTVVGTDTARVAIDWLSSVTALPKDDPLVVTDNDALSLRYRLLLAAQLQGLAETALAESNAYAKLREQFGKPIGSFQAVRHRIAEMELRARRAEAQLYFAAVALRDQRADARHQTMAALAVAITAAIDNAETNIANHGAIGVTTENIGHLLLKRALVLTALAGGRDAVLDALGETEPAVL